MKILLVGLSFVATVSISAFVSYVWTDHRRDIFECSLYDGRLETSFYLDEFRYYKHCIDPDGAVILSDRRWGHPW